MLIAILTGVVIALFTQDWKSSAGAFLGVLAASAFISFLLLHWVNHQFLVPKRRPEFTEKDSASLTSSITSSARSAYAISSNWLDLWRTSTFRYYLHLDSTMSLVAYSASLASPLDGLSEKPEDKEEFIEYGWELVAAIGDGRPPLRKHRVRLLIYPKWAYDNYEHEIMHLIRSHAAARIPCIPLVAEKLHESLGSVERQHLEQLVSELDQTALDKLPPVSRWLQSWGRLLKRLGKPLPWWGDPFPDMLLIDSSLRWGSVWWYSGDGSAEQWEAERHYQVRDATEVFELICSHAKEARWKGYDASNIGGVAMVATPDRLESEAFFTRTYYSDWLDWIQAYSETDPHAESLARWLEMESGAMRNAISKYASSKRNGQDDQLEILDIGCGFGRHLVDLLKNHPDWRGVGIDINPSMVGEANGLAKRQSVHRQASFIVDDAAVLESCTESEIDFAICMTNTLGNLTKEKQKALVRNLHRVLKPGGRAFFSAYTDSSSEARDITYKAIGLDVERDTRRKMIIAAQGLESESFSGNDLRRLLVENELRLVGGVEEIQPIGIWAVAERPLSADSKEARDPAVPPAVGSLP
jgi:SAM-dependent methyltransferase